MVVQFCEDCGHLLTASAATKIQCELCGKVAASVSFQLSFSLLFAQANQLETLRYNAHLRTGIRVVELPFEAAE